MPPGFETAGTDLKPGLARAGSLDLAEASAQLAVSQALADHRPTDTAALADGQKLFAESCRRAERALAAAGDNGEAERPGAAAQLKTLYDYEPRLQARRAGLRGRAHRGEKQSGHGVELLADGRRHTHSSLYNCSTPSTERSPASDAASGAAPPRRSGAISGRRIG